MTEAMEQQLKRLRLGCMSQNFEAQNAESIREKHSYLEFLSALIEGEIQSRENKSFQKRIKAAHFPLEKTLEEFDFNFQPSLDVKLIKSLANCQYIEKKENILLVGQCGTGKSHLAVSLGMKAIEAGYKVRFITIPDLAALLRGALADQSVEAKTKELIEPDLLILDEFGFTPLDRVLADAFYRIIASRYERSSTIVTSNKSFENWADEFPDPVIAVAVIDRLIHHAHVVPIVGESYRMKDQKKRQKKRKPKKGSD
jgi:DNA replication protein DnaC